LDLEIPRPPEVVGKPAADLREAFVERAIPDTQPGCFKQGRQGGRTKRGPVLAKEGVNCGGVGYRIIDSSIRGPDLEHVGPNSRDVSVAYAAEIPFEVRLHLTGDGHLGRWIEPFEVAADTEEPGLHVELRRRIRSGIRRTKHRQRKIITL